MRVLVGVCLLLAIPLSLAVTQSRPQLEIAAGVASPEGALGAYRRSGAVVRAGLVVTDPTHVFRVRFDAEAANMPGRATPGVSPDASSDLRVLGASANVVVGAGKFAFAPYAVLGIGAHLLRVAGTSNATSPTFGARIGGGAHVQVRRVRVALEVAPTVLATSRGTADDVWLVRFRTFSLSAAFTP